MSVPMNPSAHLLWRSAQADLPCLHADQQKGTRYFHSSVLTLQPSVFACSPVTTT